MEVDSSEDSSMEWEGHGLGGRQEGGAGGGAGSAFRWRAAGVFPLLPEHIG